jgi:excinuclease UvrABC nuclease subunit
MIDNGIGGTLESMMLTVDEAVPEQMVLDKKIPIEDIETRRPGVYFLIRENKVVYVGKSIDMIQRLRSHMADQRMEFTHVTMLKLDSDEFELDIMEKMMIRKFKPPKNRDSMSRKMRGETYPLEGR